MLRKLPAFILLAFSSCTIIYSQKTPEPAKQPEKPAKPSVFSFQFEGGSYLGFEPQEVTKENFGKFGLSQVRGVAVEKVVENSPAAQAGLQAGDVIIRFEGEEIESVRKLSRLIAEIAPDHQVKLTILRNGSEQEITATMGKREVPAMFNGNFKMEMPNFENLPKMPEGQLMPKMPDMSKLPQVPALPNGQGGAFIWKGDGETGFFFGANRQIGISVSSLTKQLGEYFGAPDGKGLLINNVRENSPAAKAGLKAGDIIVEADGKEIKNNTDLIRTLNEKKEGDVQLTIIRDRNRQTVQVTPEKLKGELTPLFDETLPTTNYRVLAPQMQIAPYKTTVPTTVTPQIPPVPMKRVL
ncbi:MAG TPA: PDZ domain-containing protein [Pyrinomonadaceae bacterium]|nr:PDZ domain-containing protein [Pyrinomonadaceae bacterium]